MVISFPDDKITALPGDKLPTGLMKSEPVPIFECDPTKMYTYMVEDNGIVCWCCEIVVFVGIDLN